jgi:hypothetical protein
MPRLGWRAMSAHRPIAALVLVAVACSSLAACGGGSGSANGATPAPGAAASGGEGVPGFGHVFLIVGENTSANQVTAARSPYLTGSIKPRAACLTRYFALSDGSLGNYVAMLSGQFIRCEANNDFSFTNGDVPGQHACHQNVNNLLHQLDGAVSLLAGVERVGGQPLRHVRPRDHLVQERLRLPSTSSFPTTAKADTTSVADPARSVSSTSF